MERQPAKHQAILQTAQVVSPGESEKLSSPQEPEEMWRLVVTWSPRWDPGQKDFRQKLNVETNVETSVNGNVPILVH